MINFDEGIKFHKIMGYIIVVCGFVHGGCWIWMCSVHNVPWNVDATITGRFCLLSMSHAILHRLRIHRHADLLVSLLQAALCGACS